MSSNFLQFNPTQANQETDTAYAVDTTRTSGAGVDALWPSTSANKTLYQVTTFVAAFGQMMANKGFTVADTVLSTLTAQLSNVLTTADVRGNLQTVAYSASIVLNVAKYLGFQVSLTGNTTLAVTGQQAGDVVVIIYAQDSVGGHTVSYSSGFIGALQPDPTPSTISIQVFKVNATLVLDAAGPLMSATGINSTPIGQSSAAAGAFVALTSSATLASTDNSTNVPTTAWSKLGFSIVFATTGYIKFPTWLGGLMVQWVTGTEIITSPDAPTYVPFYTAFPTACLFVLPGTQNPAPTQSQMSYWELVSFTAAGANLYFMRNADHNYDGIAPLVLAIGH